LSQFDQSEQQVFRSHIVVVEPLGFLARKRQDLMATWSKITHHCVSDAAPARRIWFKVDTTPTLNIYHQRLKQSTATLNNNPQTFYGTSHRLNCPPKAPPWLIYRELTKHS
jgi:hypothetical protein